MIRIVLKGLKETEKFGKKLGSLLQGGDIISLIGDLGAGKTTLTKSIGKGLGVEDYITSPTFTLINEYKGRVWVYHFDVYRLEGTEDLLDLGYEDYFYSDGVVIIEWADKIKDILPKDRVDIKIEKCNELDNRIICISGIGGAYERIKKGLDIR